MFSKKEDFLNNLQYEIGDRFNDIENTELNTANDIVSILTQRNEKAPWKFLHFLPVYFFLKSKVEVLTDQNISTDFNLNTLSTEHKRELRIAVEKEYGQSFEFRRPKLLRNFVFLFPVFGVLGALIVSTYMVTLKDASGWVFLSGLAGIILSLLFFTGTKNFKTKFYPDRLLDFSKSFYVINHAFTPRQNSKQELENFILEALRERFDDSIGLSDSIPNQ